ncbi:ribonucleotide reductase inhibitor-domain-containing protein, partial [Lophiotrema nucula]
TSAASHRDKRQYQPAITSFFARDDRDGIDIWDERGPGPITRHGESQQHHSSRPRDSLVPSVPGHVQADLLSVGMRVRKSVPEGYKTHKMNTGIALPSIQTTLSKAPPITIKPPRDAVDGPQHQRELLPFCGLHKIGGFAEQPVTNTHLYAGADSNGDRPVNLFPLPAEAFNQPFSSHDSTSSSLSTDSLPLNPLNPHKRGWQDEDGKPLHLNSNFLFALPMKVSEDDVPVSPLSETPTQSINALPVQSALRPFAQPKTRRPGGRMMDVDAALLKDSGMDMDFENAEGPGGQRLPNPSDFGEADFL